MVGVMEDLVHFLRQLYEDGTASVRTDGVLSRDFHPSAGVRQVHIININILFNAKRS